MKKKSRIGEGWRLIISILAGILTAVGIFYLDSIFINWITLGFESNDLKMIAKVILWIMSAGIAIWLSVILGLLIGKLVDILLGGRP